VFFFSVFSHYRAILNFALAKARSKEFHAALIAVGKRGKKI
jgi:hypothetical protein